MSLQRRPRGAIHARNMGCGMCATGHAHWHAPLQCQARLRLDVMTSTQALPLRLNGNQCEIEEGRALPTTVWRMVYGVPT